jgi:hypothetical protein
MIKTCQKHCKSHRKDPKRKPIVSIDFRERGLEDDFMPLLNFTDGVVTQNYTGLTVDSAPFTGSNLAGNDNPIGVDEPKWLYFYRDNIPLPKDKDIEVVVEIKITAEQSIDDAKLQAWLHDPKHAPVCGPSLPDRIVDPFKDLRLATAGLDTGVNTPEVVVPGQPLSPLDLNLFLTNKMIYIWYGVIPFRFPHYVQLPPPNNQPNSPPVQISPPPSNAAFWYAIPVKRRKYNDVHILGMGFNRTRGILRFYVDGEAVFEVTQPGVLLGADNNTLGAQAEQFLVANYGGTTTEPIEMTSIRPGFGTYDLLDTFKPRTNLCFDPNFPMSDTALLQDDYFENYRAADGSPASPCQFAITSGLSVDPNKTKPTIDYINSQSVGVPFADRSFEQGATMTLTTFNVFSRKWKHEHVHLCLK